MTIYRIGSRGDGVKKIQKALHLYADGIYGINTAEAVKVFQKENGLTADGIVGPATYALLLATELRDTLKVRKSRRKITEIIVHCSATPAGKDYTVDEIRKWHRQQGWSDIGYHYVIYRDGSIHGGRDVDIAGAHCTGHNTNSIGVCYVGGVARDGKTPKDTRTVAQAEGLENLLRLLKDIYPQAKIHGHRDFAAKACPSFDATKEYRSL